MYNNLMLYYENTMNNTKNIILITSIAAVLGFGIVAFQTNTVDALMDNTSEILDLGEKSEITTLAKPEGKGKKVTLEGSLESGTNIVKCTASNVFSCGVKNSDKGLDSVTLYIYFPGDDTTDPETPPDTIQCANKNVKPGASRASINNRKSESYCDYTPNVVYMLEVGLNSTTCCEPKYFLISTALDGTKLVIESIPKPGSF